MEEELKLLSHELGTAMNNLWHALSQKRKLPDAKQPGLLGHKVEKLRDRIVELRNLRDDLINKITEGK